MAKYSSLILSCFLSAHLLSLQAQSASDLYLFTLTEADSERYIHSAKFLSGFNKGGYTNQPWFTPMGDMLVSVRKYGDTQNDIWQLSLDTRKYKKLTSTPESEYSPRLHPDEDHLTFIRKVGTEPLDQQVYKVQMNTGVLESATINLKDIGYYTWISNNELGLLRIDDFGHKLSFYETDTHKSRRITTVIGRTLLSGKDGTLIYIHKYDKDYWYIKKYQPQTSTIEIITQTKGLNEDFTVGPDGTYYMGDKKSLYYFRPGIDKEWKLLGDLSPYGITNITRLAISPNGKQLALVSSKEGV